MKTQLNDNNAPRVMMLSAVILMMAAMSVTAQSWRPTRSEGSARRFSVWSGKPKVANPIYVGGDLSLSFPQYTLKSKIEALNGLKVSYIGTNLGGVVGNRFLKLKATAGLYYSTAAVPYTMEMIQGTISGNFYPFRLVDARAHTLEPYIVVGVAHQLTKFYGNYLPAENSSSSQTNYSCTEMPLLNNSNYNQTKVGAGVEYRIENLSQVFVHIFAEVNYRMLISSSASNVAFGNTVMHSPSSFSLGINFGVIK